MNASNRWIRARLPLFALTALLCLGAANIASRATWREVEDGVLWTVRDGGVVAADIAPGTPADAIGLRRGDVLLTIDNQPVEDVADVVAALHDAGRGTTLRYTILRLGSSDVIDVRLAPIPGRPAALEFVLPPV